MNQNKTCKQCQNEFTVADDDLAFYKKISPTFDGKTFEIPVPGLCPDCRRQRRLVWRDHKFLYQRPCDLCGKPTVTTFSKEKPFPVYCQDCWWSDKWGPLSYGQDFDPEKSFFEQFKELNDKVPHLALMNRSPENSEFCNNAGRNKNCYLMNGGCWDNENCAYGIRIDRSRECIENRMVSDSELCLRCIFGENLYKCAYCHHCFNSRECYFSVNLRNCDHCLFSSNLNSKSYYIYNKPSTKEKFEEIVAKMSSYTKLEELEKKYSEMLKGSIYPPVTQKNCENCTGDYLHDSKNAIESYDAFDIEDVKFLFIGEDCRDAMDVTSVGMQGSQLLYECMSTGVGAFNCLFDHGNWTARENLYCDTMMSSNNCFGCVSLKHKEFCILNKQYPKEKYEKLVAEIIQHMQKMGEWGEFLPLRMAPFAYNESIAQEYYPLDEQAANKIGASWTTMQPQDFDAEEFYQPKDLVTDYSADEIDKLSDAIMKCKVSGKLFKLNPVEINFFIKNKIAIPRKHHEVRYDELAEQINPKKLYHRKCMNENPSVANAKDGKCQNEFETTYAPDRPEKVFCEKCYLELII